MQPNDMTILLKQYTYNIYRCESVTYNIIIRNTFTPQSKANREHIYPM